MIHDVSTMDKPVDNEPERMRRRVTWIAAATVLVLGGFALAPSIGRWVSSETSVPRAQIRVATITRGDLIREVAVDGRVVAGSHPTAFSPAQGIATLLVEAGEVVETGQILGRVESPEIENRLEQERASLAAIHSDHQRLSISNRKRRLENRQDVELAEVRVAAAERSLGNGPVGQPAERQALQPDFAVPAQRGQEHTLAAKEHGLQVAGTLDVVACQVPVPAGNPSGDHRIKPHLLYNPNPF